MHRRSFLKAAVIAPVAVISNPIKENDVSTKDYISISSPIASIIDLDKCDGCSDFEIPKCVNACKEKNKSNFPEPIKDIPSYFPRKIKEDYSKNRDNISRLTPYNWTFVQSVEVDSKKVFIPRRCMHCDDATCQKLCPFGVIAKDKFGAISIDKDFCFGGAKCRDVCPWGIPQRQAGVGIYLDIAPKLAGGGVMFKCDMCADLLRQNKKPVCESKCPKNAIIFDKKELILKKIEKERNSGKFIYGDVQNGGTNTFYISSISFEEINLAIAKMYDKKDDILDKRSQNMGQPHMNIDVKNFINDDSALVKSVLLAPFAGIVAGMIAVSKSNKKDSKTKGDMDEKNSN